MKKVIMAMLLLITLCLCSCTGNNNVATHSGNDVENNIQESTTDNVAVENKTENGQESNDLVVLYYGITLNTDDQNIDVTEDGNKNSANETQKNDLHAKYDITYDLYENGTYLESVPGHIEGRGLDYYWYISFPGIDYNPEIAVSQQYNPYPRESTYMESDFPAEFQSDGKVLSQVNKEFDVNANVTQICIVDLDGDGKDEYLAFAVDEDDYFFTKCLLDADYNIISYMTVFQEEWDDFNDIVSSNGYYGLLEGGEVLDKNNDDIMEIVVTQPTYEGLDFQVFTYNDGNFSGDFITMSTLKP